MKQPSRPLAGPGRTEPEPRPMWTTLRGCRRQCCIRCRCRALVWGHGAFAAQPPVCTLVLGLGNPLMGDDGLGLAALERLATRWVVPPEVQLLDGGTGGLQLLPPIEDADRLILLDAIEAGEAPGRLVVLERDELPRYFAHKLSPHEIALRDVLALAELRDRLPADLVAIGLQPGRVTMGPGLSPEVEAGVPAMLDAVVARLEHWECRLPLATREAHA
jgi:hydrogenase maturation protease